MTLLPQGGLRIDMVVAGVGTLPASPFSLHCICRWLTWTSQTPRCKCTYISSLNLPCSLSRGSLVFCSAPNLGGIPDFSFSSRCFRDRFSALLANTNQRLLITSGGHPLLQRLPLHLPGLALLLDPPTQRHSQDSGLSVTSEPPSARCTRFLGTSTSRLPWLHKAFAPMSPLCCLR